MAVANGDSRMTFVRASLLAIAVSAVVPLTAQRVSPPKPDPAFLVEFGRAGAFTVDMTVDDALAIVGRENTKLSADYAEGMFGPQIEIRLPGFAKGPAITAPIGNMCGYPSLAGLMVFDPRYKTSHGIGVGSTLADIRKYKPSAKIVDFGTDGFPGVLDAERGVSFAFRDATASVPTARVTALWVHSGPNARSIRCPSDRDWAAVFQSVLNDVVARRDRGVAAGQPIVVIRETIRLCDADRLAPLEPRGCLERSRMTAPFLVGDLAKKFLGSNSGQYPVPMLDGASALVEASELTKVFPAESRRIAVTFSSPGFDNGRAAVYVGYNCGNLCGEGMLVLLTFKDSKWQVTTVQPLWVS